jgi:multiple sugar transport system permease protein
MISSNRRPSRKHRVALYSILAFFLLIASFPPYWILLTSLKKGRDVFRTAEVLLPRKLTLFNYVTLLREGAVVHWMAVSTALAIVSTLAALVIAILAAYSLTHFKYRGRKALGLAVFFAYVIPKGLLFIPLFLLLNEMRLVDTFLGLVLAHETFSVPFCTWLLYGYFRTQPRELIDAGRIDGCRAMGILRWIILPLAAPAIATAAIFSFTTSWNEFLYAASLVASDGLKTLPLGISGFILADSFVWGSMMAAATIATVPMVILFILLQRYVVQGLTLGAVKG